MSTIKNINIRSTAAPQADVKPSGDQIGLRMLLNVRPCQTKPGVLEQTPRFYTQHTLSQGTYDGGTDSSGSRVTFVDRDPNTATSVASRVAMTENCLWRYSGSAWAQQQVYIQSAVPNNTTATGRCLMVPQVASLGVTLGSTLDVEIDAATTFRWRYNGGGWTAGVAIASTVTISLGGNNVNLYFLATSGFTIGNLWQWTRTDKSYCNRTPAAVWHDGKLYYAAPYNNDPPDTYRVFVYDPAISTAYSLGYRPVHGKRLVIDNNHLFVSEFSETAVASNGTDYLGCSDLNDFHNFLATDVNEADTFALSTIDTVASQSLIILGFSKRGTVLSVITTIGIFTAPYLGLPIPYKFDLTIPFAIALKRYHTYGSNNYVLQGQDVDYILGTDAVYSYDGALSRTIMTYPCYLGLAQNFVNQAAYNNTFGEVLVIVESYETASPTYYLMCMQERTGAVYYRAMPYADIGDPFLTTISGQVTLGLGTRKIAWDDDEFTQTPLADLGSATYTAPRIITALATGNIGNTFDFMGAYVGAYVKDNGTGYSSPGAAYDSAGNVGVKVYWAVVNDGYLGFVRWPGVETTNTFSSATNAKWVEGANSGALVSFPRTFGSDIVLAFELVGTTKPPCQIYVSALALGLRGGGATR